MSKDEGILWNSKDKKLKVQKRLVHRSQNSWTNAQNVFLRVLFKKRRRSGLRRGFLNGAIEKTGKYSVQLFKIRCTRC